MPIVSTRDRFSVDRGSMMPRKKKVKKTETGRMNGRSAPKTARNTLLSDLAEHQNALQVQCEVLEETLRSVEAVIETISGSPYSGGRGDMRPRLTARSSRVSSVRGPREGSLVDYIRKVLTKSNKALRPVEIARLVVQAGYPTKSANLTASVNNALPKVPGVKKASRGHYTMK